MDLQDLAFQPGFCKEIYFREPRGNFEQLILESWGPMQSKGHKENSSCQDALLTSKEGEMQGVT